MPDEYENNASGLDSPAKNAAAITPDNDNDLANTTRGIYVGVGGDVRVDMAGTGSTITFKGAATGSILPIRAERIYATGTTATDLVALW